MKLVRLTKDTFGENEPKSGIFNNDFNDGILLKPNSKIALQSVSADLETKNISITANNGKILFSFKTTVTLSTELTPFNYNLANSDLILTNVAMSLNNCLNYNDDDNRKKLLGMEFDARLGSGGLLDIAYRIGIAGEYGDPSQGLLYAWVAQSKVAVNNNPEDGTGVYGLLAGTTPVDTFRRTILNRNYISKGNGYFRAQVRKLGKTGSDSTNGMIMGLTKASFDPSFFSFAERDIKYGIKITIVEADGTLQLYHIHNGVQTLSAVVPSAVVSESNDNDILEVAIDGSSVDLNIYQGASATKTEIFSYSYARDQETGGGEELHPFMTFIADRDNAEFTDVRFTPSPWNPNYFNPQIPDVFAGQFQPHAGMSPPTNASPISKTSNFLQFDNRQVALYLGFVNTRIPSGGTISGSQPVVFNGEGQLPFFEGTEVRGFNIQLLNINVNSYDALRNQRENLLAVVPDLNFSGKLVYSPPTPYFIELNNKDEINLRNVKARITNIDYTDVIIDGFAQINLLIE